MSIARAAARGPRHPAAGSEPDAAPFGTGKIVATRARAAEIRASLHVGPADVRDAERVLRLVGEGPRAESAKLAAKLRRARKRSQR